jgi:hypothetical protein
MRRLRVFRPEPVSRQRRQRSSLQRWQSKQSRQWCFFDFAGQGGGT